MGLYKRDSVWWMSFSHNGKQIRRSTETEDKKLAIRIFDKLKGEIAEGKWFEKLPGENYTFEALMDKYMKEYSAVNKKPSSHIRDKSLNNHLQKSFGQLYLPEITSRLIAEYKIKRRNEGACSRTVNYELSLMNHAFNMAIREWELIESNPVSKVKKERVRNIIERWLSVDEEKKLLLASPRWLQVIIIFAINTGLRRGEILSLKLSQIDFNRRTLIIYEQKNGAIDTLPLNQKAMGILEDRRRNKLPDCDLAFPSQNGTRILDRNLFRGFNAALKRAQIENFRFHDLRHTFATRLVQTGVGIYEVQKLGRWKNASMVMRYAHHNPESLRSSIEVLDSFEKPFITILSQYPKKEGSQASLKLATL
ncbi:MAG TPA: site-specific integrase [Smithella sp.]|nr:site-specific integrase [Smithella sp.]